MKILDSGTVFASRPKTDAASACFPSICALDSGRWLAGFRLGPAKLSRAQGAFVSWSDDEGKTWSEPRNPGGPVPTTTIDGRPGTWRTVALTPVGGRRVVATLCREDYSRPFLPMFNEQTEGLMDMKIYTAFSEDGGETFSAPKPVDCGKYRDVPTATTGPMLVMPDGTWMIQFEVNKHYFEPAPWQHASAIVISRDKGATWSDAVDVHTDPQRRIFCWDQRLAVAPPGNALVALFWTFDRAANAYLNIRSRRSHDGGRTWGPLADTGVAGQPARLAALDERRMVMVYVDRSAVPVVKARWSSDGGHTWPANTELLVHDRPVRNQTWNKSSMQDAWAEMSQFSIGLPDAIPLPGGTVLAVCYTGNSPDHTDIHWARIGGF
jgi:hypothetical protein